jgi:hypothetical protein
MRMNLNGRRGTNEDSSFYETSRCTIHNSSPEKLPELYTTGQRLIVKNLQNEKVFYLFSLFILMCFTLAPMHNVP